MGVKGHAPGDIEWTFPNLMQAVLERRRKHPSIWLGDLDERACSPVPRESLQTADT